MSDFEPADTRIMTIVHNGLRRDLNRAQIALRHWPYPDSVQRAAIADHLAWLIGFLDMHHHAEDEGLYPVVHQRLPEAAELLSAMKSDHHVLAKAMDRMGDAARDYAASNTAREALLAAVDGLASAMLPHLQSEEEHAMPVVSRCMSRVEWEDWDQRYNIKKRSRAELAFTGLWLVDGAAEADRDVVRSLGPRWRAWAVGKVHVPRLRTARLPLLVSAAAQPFSQAESIGSGRRRGGRAARGGVGGTHRSHPNPRVEPRVL